MASTVARCIVSLGSKISPRYSNWETSRIGYEQVSEVGKGDYTCKGGMVGNNTFETIQRVD